MGFWVSRAVIAALMWLLVLLPNISMAQSLPGLVEKGNSQSAPEPNVIEIEAAGILVTYNRWLDEIAEVEAEISLLGRESGPDASKVESLIDRMRTLTDEADQMAAEAQSRLAGPTSALTAIGAPPKAGEPPEADIIADERVQHQSTLAKLNAELAFVRLIKARVETATGLLGGYWQDRLKNWVLARDDITTLLSNPPASDDVTDLFRDLRPGTYQSSISDFGVWLPVLAVFIALGALAVSVWLIKGVPKFNEDGKWEDTYEQRELAYIRFSAALGYGALPAIACAAFAAIGIYYTPSLGQWLGLIAGLLLGLAVYIWLFRIFEVALEPTNQQARFLRGSDDEAHRISKLLQGLCVLNSVFVAGYVVLKLSTGINAEILLALKLATVAFFSGYAFFAARQKVFGEADPNRLPRLYYALRIGAALIGTMAVISALAGFVNLAVFASVNIAASILLIAATYFIRPMLHDGIRALASSDEATFKEPQSGLIKALIHLLLDLAMMIMFSVLMLSLWGIPLDGIWLWVKQTANVLTIGDFRLKLLDLAAAAASFVIALIILKIVVRVMRNQILDRVNIDAGVKNSITTILGYASVLLAFIFAIVTLGFDVTSLALVFGALLFGIGFGLQNVVDNLISGMIILFQRPIKPGDWINVGSYEGLVQKTGLLSTEITTFDDASVVLPNSDIVTTAVLNRTLGRTRGRVDVPVGVAYGSDVGTVLQILRDCAAANEYVLKEPEPTVVLRDFSDSSLDFELRAYIPDIRNIFELASEIRIDILKRFRKEGIEIPFPQRDIWVKNSETISEALPAEDDNSDEV
jgi:potassium efflux system protein